MKRWRDVPSDDVLADALCRKLSLPRPVARLLVARGHRDEASIERFLRPRLSDTLDPCQLPGMRAAAGVLWAAVKRRERLVVFGDYDVDGITSAALLVRVLGGMGAKVAWFLPHRVEDGYGLSVEALEKCLERHQPELIVTVDCGTGAVDAVRRAEKKGTRVIVTDHHESSGAVAPALAVVNPKLDPATRDSPLAGVGVTFKLCHALLRHAREAGEVQTGIDLRDDLDLVALGTVADVVPLVGENRILVSKGLERLAGTNKPGLQALKTVAGIDGEISAYHVGFVLGPRLNAAGRLGDAEAALELLLTADKTRALELATHLDQTNRERRDLEAHILEEAVADLDARFDPDTDFGLVAQGKGWHPGVIGIVASRLCEKYYRPTIVIGRDESGRCRGSCRSIAELNLVDALAECADLLVKQGGHAMAAGLEIEPENLAAFRARFNEIAARRLQGIPLSPELRVDAWLELAEADEGLLAQQGPLRPFGQGNPTPVWAVRAVRVAGRPREVGKGHIKFRVAHGGVERECIGFGMAGRGVPDGLLDLAFQLKRNSYGGFESLQLVLQDYRVAAEA